MDNPKQAVVDRLKQANNVLVTVKAGPSVDQLAACIGLSLTLNKLDKHATAVFSGEVPSAIEFLQPEQTIEKDTDSLRDFIISLDKSKADKLRYKVEDQVVRIFITPYKTSITDQDLDFSQGDFNVDVVLALGVQEQGDVDTAITAHGRILHDATIITLNNTEGGELGTLNWLDTNASSLSEMATSLATTLNADILDEQIATAFLTGIVAETDRFSNEKTSSDTMKISAALMAAGANQQLVATKLEEEPVNQGTANDTNEDSDGGKIHDDGTLEITHDKSEEAAPAPEGETSEQLSEFPEENSVDNANPPTNSDTSPNAYQNPRTLLSEPAIGSPANPATVPAEDDGNQPLESLSLPPVEDKPPLLSHDAPMAHTAEVNTEKPKPAVPALEEPPTFASFNDMKQALEPQHKPDLQPSTEGSTETLADIERQVNSPHLAQSQQLPSEPAKPVENHMEELDLSQLQRPAGLEDEPQVSEVPAAPEGTHVDAAREAVDQAIQASGTPSNAPIAALNAQPLGDPLHSNVPEAPAAPMASPAEPPVPPATPAFPETQPPAGPAANEASQPAFPPLPSSVPQQQAPATVPSSAPPVPPPIMPPTFGQ